MIQVQGLHHVSLVVTDLAQARQFYSKVLGLIEIERPAFDFPGAWLAVGEGQLHLIVHPRAQRPSGAAAIDTRQSHCALRVQSTERPWSTSTNTGSSAANVLITAHRGPRYF